MNNRLPHFLRLKSLLTHLCQGIQGLSGRVGLGVLATIIVLSGFIGVACYANTYETWVANTFTPADQANPAVSGPTANPTSDGIANLQKYAFGLNPYQHVATGLPVSSLIQQNGSQYLALTYQMPANDPPTDLLYTPEASADLQTWQQGPSAMTLYNIVGPSNGLNYYTYYNAPLPIPASRLAFVRLQINHFIDISLASGTYSSPQQVTITAPPGSVLFYTLDGTQPSSTSFMYTGPLTISSPATLSVQAYVNNSPFGGVAVANYVIGSVPYTAPVNISATYDSTTQVTVTWADGGAGAEGFIIQQSSDGGTTWTTVGTAPANATSFIAGGLTPGTNYSFRVVANGAAGNSTPSLAAVPPVYLQITGGTTPPAMLTLTATPVSSLTGVTSITFYEGETLLGTDSTSPYTITVSNVAAGLHTYTAVVNTATGIAGQGSADFTVAVPATPFDQFRYSRGTGSDPSFQTFVIALNQTNGFLFDAMGNNTSHFPFNQEPWFTQITNTTGYHVSVTGSPTSQTATFPNTTATQFQNPVVAFGAAGLGTPLYTNQSYSFGFGSGGQDTAMTIQDLRIQIFSKASPASPPVVVTFQLPRPGPVGSAAATDWTAFAQNGFTRTYALTSGGTTYPLVTTFRYQTSGLTKAGAPNDVTFESGQNSPFVLTHIDTSTGDPAYYYEIDYKGVAVLNATGTPLEQWMALLSSNTNPNPVTASNSTISSAAYSLGYTLDFIKGSASHSTFISQPNFQGQPLPAAYAGKSVAELLNVSTPITYQFANPTTALTTIDNSPELRQHPVLDKLVSDLTATTFGNSEAKAMTLANYVLNNIQLTDALSYDRNGVTTDNSLNCGGVDRGAMATYMEGQGNPVEQCALLIYMLRKAGVPCGYVFPANDTLQMLDERMSNILRMQLHNAVKPDGTPVSIPNQIIPVNYPWVAAYVGGTYNGSTYAGGKWVHIFPWMKDTSITEGYDLNSLMPGPGSGSPTANATGYKSGFAWMQNYLMRDSNIRSLNSQFDDAGHLFVPFIQAQLSAYHPDISIDDIGINAFDRQNTFSSWAQFPQPWGFAGTLSATNFEPTLAQLDANDAALTTPIGSVFNTATVTLLVSIPALSSSLIQVVIPFTVDMVDLHNRRLMLSTTGTPSAYTVALSLAPFRPGAANLPTDDFTSTANLVDKQVRNAVLTLGSIVGPESEDAQYLLQVTYNRNLNLPTGFTPPTTLWGPYLGISDIESFTEQNAFFAGDLVTYCIDFGRVTQRMLDIHAQNYWAAQQAVLNGSGTSVDPDDLIGEPLYVMGMTYYKAGDDLDATTAALYKTTVLGRIGNGTAKMNVARASNGSWSGGVITPLYPCFDVATHTIGDQVYNTAHADTATIPYAQDDRYVSAAGESANEHAVINNFFNLTDSASTVHVLDVSQINSHPIRFLTSENYTAEGAMTYTATQNNAGTLSSTTKALSAWAGSEWAPLQAFFAASPYAFAYVTPGNVTCANGSYLGMGYFIGDGYGATESLLAFNQQQIPFNGGSGQAIPSTYSITNTTSGASSPSNWILTYKGGQYNLLDTQISTSNQYFFTGSFDEFDINIILGDILAGTYLPSTYDINAYHAANILLGNAAVGSPPPITPAAMGAEVASVQTAGSLGKPTFSAHNVTGKSVDDPVDVVEGGFHVDDSDLSMPGPMPIQLQRHYYSLNQADNEFGFGWELNYESYLMVSSDSPPVIYAAEMDGSVIAYTQQTGSTTRWVPTPAKNPSLVNQSGNQLGGLINLFNNHLDVSGSTYTLTGADGSVRTYVMSSPTQYQVGSGANIVSRQRPYLTTWQDPQGNTLTFTIGNNSTSNDYGKLSRITSSNGNFVQLDYDMYGHIITAIANDGRQCSYTYDTYGDLTSVTRTDGSTVSYVYDHQTQTVNSAAQTYSDHLLTTVNKPNSRQLVNTYDTSRRVTQQQATVGANGALVTNATFVYNVTGTNTDGTINGTTTVTAYQSSTLHFATTYTYANSEITEIQDPVNPPTFQSWYQTTGSGGYQRSLQQRIDGRSLTQNFTYDSNGNLIQTDNVGDITGSGTSVTHTTTATFNAQNLPTKITDTSTGNYSTFGYTSPISPYLISLVQSYASGGLISQTAYTYGNVGQSSTFANGVLLAMDSDDGTTDQADTSYTYTPQGYVASERINTGTSDPAVTFTFAYNASGQLVQTTDAAGRYTQMGYDGLGHVISNQVFDQYGNLQAWHYNYYDRSGELQWTNGPRFNPDDYAYRAYDGAGRLTQFLQYRSQAAGGTGVQQATGNGFIATTSHQYDFFGDEMVMMDPNGNTAQMSYDGVGQMLTRSHYQNGTTFLASEGFTYEPGGKTATYTNELGGQSQYTYTQTGQIKKQVNPDSSTQFWTYQLDGRLSQVKYPNGSTRTLSYNDLNRTVTNVYKDGSNNTLAQATEGYDRRGNLIQKTDVAGFTTSTTYDALDRVKTVTGPPAVTGSAQQTIAYSYDAAGIVQTSTNAAGETTTTIFDVLNRPVQVTVNSASSQTVRRMAYEYSPDHQAVTSIDGGNTNVTTTYTDIQGNPVLVKKADGGFVLSQYDSNENLLSTTDEMGRKTSYAYDGLNRVQQQTLPDNAATNFTYDLSNRIFTRAMPNNLTWSATFDTSSRKVSEKLVQGSNTTRTYGYLYFPSGELQQVTDPRSIVSTYAYDGFDRVHTVTAVDASSAHLGLTQTYSYDNRGLLTQLDQVYQNSSVSPSTSVVRTYNGYGAIATERTYINGTFGNGGTLKDTWQETHDNAGRRTQLEEVNYSSKPFGYTFQADGSLTQTTFNGSNFQYFYGTDGLLTTRTTPWNTLNIVSRDSVGRITEQKQTVNSTAILDESGVSWRADSTQGSYTASRTGTGTFNETRNYGYDDSSGGRGHLLTESFAPSSGTTATLTYQFDGNTTGGLGQRTSSALTGSITGTNISTFGTYARLTQQTLTGSELPASGSPVNDTLYDATGQLTTHTPGSNSDTLTWDALGRLVSMQRNPTGNGFSWSAVYDGLGRRLKTTQQTITGGTPSGSPLVTQSSYDPDVQFLELASTVGTQREWLVHGPDLTGGYGDLQGTGGVDAVVKDSTSSGIGVISDIYGHVEATVSGTTVTWNPVRSTGYGPEPNTPPQALDGTHDLSTLLAWRGRYIDGNGFYYLGNRYYDPTSGTFLSCDPLGHAASMDLYSYCGGDPVNSFDPEGLLGKYTDQQYQADVDSDEQMMAFEAYRMRAILPTDPGAVTPFQRTMLTGISRLIGPSQADLTQSPQTPLGSGSAHLAALYQMSLAKSVVDFVAIGSNPSRIITGQPSYSQGMIDQSYLSQFTYSERSGADFNIGAATFFLPIGDVSNGANAVERTFVAAEAANPLLQPGAEYSIRINPITGKGPMAIDTSTFTSGEATMNGGVRNSQQFWKNWANIYPETLSEANLSNILEEGISPAVDEQWIKYFPEHSNYMDETLIHHHLDYGPLAVPLPQTVHSLQPGWGIWHQ